MGTRVRVLNIVICSTMDVTGLPSLIVQLIPFYVCWYHHSWAHPQPKHTLSSFCLKVHYCILYCLIKVSNQINQNQLDCILDFKLSRLGLNSDFIISLSDKFFK